MYNFDLKYFKFLFHRILQFISKSDSVTFHLPFKISNAGMCLFALKCVVTSWPTFPTVFPDLKYIDCIRFSDLFLIDFPSQF